MNKLVIRKYKEHRKTVHNLITRDSEISCVNKFDRIRFGNLNVEKKTAAACKEEL